MVKTASLCLMLCFLFSTAVVSAAEQPLFGPRKYAVLERYGRENRYQAAITVKEGRYLIKLQNGEQPRERPDILALSVNGEILLREDIHEHPFFACVVDLGKENTLELVIKDLKPTGFKRPTATSRNVIITIIPLSFPLDKGVFGLHAWDDFREFAGIVHKIKAPGSAALSIAAMSQQNDIAVRIEAVRKLSDSKDQAVLELMLYLFQDFADRPKARGEAALTLGVLGGKEVIPVLTKGLFDTEETIRTGSARALSLYKEEYTKDQLAGAFTRMDSIRRTAVVQTMENIGWRPVDTLLELAGSSDPDLVDAGLELLKGSSDRRVIEYLLASLDAPGRRDIRLIIAALGASKDPRAIGPLSLLADDPVKRRGAEGELGLALAALGDPKSADLIVTMIKQADSRATYMKLIEAYKLLTGKEYAQGTGAR